MQRNRKTAGSLIAALDIGTTKVACVIARILDDQNGLEIVGVGYHASSGIKNGAVIDIDATENSVRKAVHTAENMAAGVMKSFPLRDIILSIPGVLVKSRTHRVNVQISGHEVTENDIMRALLKAQETAQENIEDEHSNIQLVHTIPTDFSLDGQSGIREPRGMYGQSLNVDVQVVGANATAVRNYITTIERSHLNVDEICAAPYASALSTLVEDEMDLGCTVIDMGGGITSGAVFYNNRLIHMFSIPVGGAHVTNDIAKGVTIAVADAERIKTLYGHAMMTGSDEEEMIDVTPMGERSSESVSHIPRSYINSIIQPRIEEIFELARAELSDSGLGHMIGRRVVLTGGASQLSGMRDIAGKILDKQVRLGRPVRLSGLPESLTGPEFSNVAGLIIYAMWHANETPSEIFRIVEPGSLWERLKLWFMENW